MALIRMGIKARDDRGRAVFLGALGSDAQEAAIEAANDPGLADLRLRVGASILPADVWRRGLKRDDAWMVLVWMLFFGGAFAFSAYLPSAPIWMYGLLMAPVVLVSVRWAMNSRFHKHEQQMINAFLSEGRCPSCAYIVHGVPVDADGCVACPECGAAWRRERVGVVRSAPAAVQEQQRRITSPTPVEQLLGGWRKPLVILDVRGRAVSIIDPLLRRLSPETAERIGKERVARVRKQMRRMHRRTGLSLGVIIVFSIPAMLMGVFRGPRPGAGFFGVSLHLVMSLFMVWVVWLQARLFAAMVWGEAMLSPERAAGVLLDYLICPGCCTPLDDVMPDSADVCECPTCHGAWSVPRHPGVDLPKTDDE